jgi:hypothetical protein
VPASIVVVPRERFTSLPASLRSRFAVQAIVTAQVIDELVGETQDTVATT